MTQSADGRDTRVVMHNNLVRHTLKSFARLGAMEHKIIAAAVAQIDHRSDTIPDIELEIAEIAKAAGIKSGQVYPASKQAARNLCGEVLEFDRPDNGNHVICSWMASAEYHKGEGTMTCTFAKPLKPLLTALKECRTEMELASIMQIGGSAYAHRLYQLACSYRSRNGWISTIEELREQLGVKPKDYPRLYDFKKRVLDGPIEILNERTDLRIGYKKGNPGRSWKSIEFTVLSQSSRPEIKQAEKVPKWEQWFEEKLETEEGQDVIWKAAQELDLAPAGERGGLSLSKKHSFFRHAAEIYAEARQSKIL